MNVASKDLCQELYELSGWDETGFEYSLYDKSVIAVEGPSTGSPKFVTAYPLGYLLRKLPNELNAGKDTAFLVVGATSETDWIASYETVEPATYPQGCSGVADNPEDALCSLAIELLKGGLLPSEHKTEARASQERES